MVVLSAGVVGGGVSPGRKLVVRGQGWSLAGVEQMGDRERVVDGCSGGVGFGNLEFSKKFISYCFLLFVHAFANF